jgi:chemotaxis protein MotB
MNHFINPNQNFMRSPQLFLLWSFSLALLFSSCVSNKKYMAANDRIDALKSDSLKLSQSLASTSTSLEEAKKQNADLKNRLGSALTASTELSSVLSSKERTIEEQQERLAALQSLIDQQRATMNKLRETVANALTQYKADELEVYQKDGRLYVSLQDKLVFQSGSAAVNKDGQEALGKLASVLNNNPEIQVMVEGHTDSIPMRGRYEDNWGLSVARATSIVRILVNTYQVDPNRVIASGHSSHDPRDTNTTPEGRARNRRTEIILTPKLDELYKLLN